MTDLEALLALSLLERMDGIGPEAREALQIAAVRIRQAGLFAATIRFCLRKFTQVLEHP